MHRDRKIPVNIIIITSFILLAILNTVELMHFKTVPTFPSGDLPFHWQRIQELIQSRHLFPYYDLNSFKDCGSAVMAMYPYLWLYPVALLYRVAGSVTVTTVGILGLNTLASLLISYYASLRFSRSRMISYFFALAYSFSFTLFLNTVHSYAIGMNEAFIFMPLVIFGYLTWLKDRKWVMLAIGTTALAYSEVLVVIFMAVLLSIWTLINIFRLDRRWIVNLIKAANLTVLLTALYWLPAVHLYLDNRLFGMGNPRITGVMLSRSFRTAWDVKWTVGSNNVFLMTIYTLLGLIFGLEALIRGGHLHKQMYAGAVLVLLLTSRFFPWTALRSTSLNIIQYLWRFYLFSQMVLTYLFAEVTVKVIIHLTISSRARGCVMISLAALVVGLQLFNQAHYFVTLPAITRGASIRMNDRKLFDLNDAEYHDYYLQRTNSDFHKIEQHDVTLPDGRPAMKFLSSGHGDYAFRCHRNYRQVTIPFIRYYGTHYRIDVDGRPVHVISNRNQLMTIRHIIPGRHHVQIKIEPDSWIRSAKGLSFTGILICLWILTVQWIRKFRND